MARSKAARTWRFDYAMAADLLGADHPLDLGDRVMLGWQGELRRPTLLYSGVGAPHAREGIVVDVERDWFTDLPTELVVALIDEGVDADES